MKIKLEQQRILNCEVFEPSELENKLLFCILQRYKDKDKLFKI